jgi:hypothetical protein
MFSVGCAALSKILNDSKALLNSLIFRQSRECCIIKRKNPSGSNLSQGLSTEEVDAFSLALGLVAVQRGRESYKSECYA